MPFSRDELAALQRLLGHPTIYALATGEPARGTPPDVIAEALAVRDLFRAFSSGAPESRLAELEARLLEPVKADGR